MKLLILGGSGFVSGTLTRMALERGNRVWCVTRGTRELPKGATALVADRNDPDALREMLEKAGETYDCVMDCICYNAEQAENAMKVLPPFCKRIVVISTDSVYHPAHKRVPQNEDAEVYLTDGGYGANKREMEEAYLKDGGRRLCFTIFRPGHIYGAGSKLGCYPELTRRDDLKEILLSGAELPLVGGGEYLFQPIWAGDLCRCMLECVGNEKTYNRIFCIGGPDVISNAEYYRILGRILDCPVKIGNIPEEGYLEVHPQYSGHLCQRVYDLTRLREAGLTVPGTHIEPVLRRQLGR